MPKPSARRSTWSRRWRRRSSAPSSATGVRCSSKPAWSSGRRSGRRSSPGVSTGKSGALDHALDLVSGLQADAVADYRRQQQTSAGGTAPEPLQHFYTSNATLEWFGPAARDSAGVAMVRDELLGWLLDFDSYRAGRGGDRQSWLSLWSGGALKIDRKSADTIFAEHPVVGVTGGIQPGRLPELARDAGADGFLSRFLLAMPDAKAPRFSESTIDRATLDAARAIPCRLRQRDYHDPLPLSRDARDRFKRFCDENADAIDGGGVHDLFLAAYGKLPLQTAKLALVLHGVHDPDATTSEIPVDRVADAIDLVDYYAAHGVRAYALLAPAPARPVGLARRILSAVNRAETPRVSRRDLHGLLGGHVASDDLSRALDDLCDRGRLVSERVSTGGRPAELYWLPDSLPCERTKLAEQSPGSGSSLLGERTKLDEQSAAGVRPANVVDFRDERSAIAAALEVLFAASGQIRTPEQRSYYDGLDLDGLAALVLDLPPDQRADWRRVIDGAPDRDEVALAARHATARAERQEGRAS